MAISNKPSIVLSYSPVGPDFPISAQCEMPNITVTATLKDITPDPKAVLSYVWNIALVFDGKGCPHFTGQGTTHPPITATTTVNSFKIPFSAMRGGDLTIKVSVQGGNQLLTGQSSGLRITGTNPPVSILAVYAPATAAFRKLMQLESALRQFFSPRYPLYSQDNKGGVGLCQITRPHPSADQIWSWKANVDAGWSLYQEKEATARVFPAHIRKGDTFKQLVSSYNDARYKKQQEEAAKQPKAMAAAAAGGSGTASVKPTTEVVRRDLTISLPDFTDEQLQLDTLRGFNGYSDGLHEYRLSRDAAGLLAVTVDEANLKGKASWDRLTAAQRIVQLDADGVAGNDRGDPNYVDDVMAQAGF